MKHIKKYNESLRVSTRKCLTNQVEFDIEERRGKIYILIERIGASSSEYSTHYLIDNDEFYQEFIQSTDGSEYDINEYNSIRFKSIEECVDFLEKIGIKRL
jgi:glycogen synthase